MLSNGKKRKQYKHRLTEDAIKNDKNDSGFFSFKTIWRLFWAFLTLQDKRNMRTLSENIKFICTRGETEQKSSPTARFSTCV
jgi:hypothetical protein